METCCLPAAVAKTCGNSSNHFSSGEIWGKPQSPTLDPDFMKPANNDNQTLHALGKTVGAPAQKSIPMTHGNPCHRRLQYQKQVADKKLLITWSYDVLYVLWLMMALNPRSKALVCCFGALFDNEKSQSTPTTAPHFKSSALCIDKVPPCMPDTHLKSDGLQTMSEWLARHSIRSLTDVKHDSCNDRQIETVRYLTLLEKLFQTLLLWAKMCKQLGRP